MDIPVLAKVINLRLQTKCSCRVIKSISNSFHQGSTDHDKFLLIFAGKQ